MLHVRPMESRALGFCAGLESIRTRPWVHSICDRRVWGSLRVDAFFRSERDQWERFAEFPFAKQARSLFIRRERRNSGLRSRAVVDSADCRVAARRPSSYFL